MVHFLETLLSLLPIGPNNNNAVIFVDLDLLEALKWSGLGSISAGIDPILPFEKPSGKLLAQITAHKPQKVLFLTLKFLSTDVVNVMKDIVLSISDTGSVMSRRDDRLVKQVLDCFIYTSDLNKYLGLNSISRVLGQDILSHDEVIEYLSDYNSVFSILLLPIYTLPIIAKQFNMCKTTVSLETYVLADSFSKDVQCLSLNNLGTFNSSTLDRFHISDVMTADLPQDTLNSLQILALNILGTCIHELGLNISGKIFALGKTSTTMGYFMAENVERLMRCKADNENVIENEIQNYIRLNCKANTNSNCGDCEAASLILIDRSEDFASPTKYCQQTSVANRILNTIRRKITNCNAVMSSSFTEVDVSLNTLNEAMSLYGFENTNIDEQNKCLPAVQNLDLPIRPSLCPSHQDEEDKIITYKIRQALFCSDEDEFKASLVELLLDLCKQNEISKLPPDKKRGLGAEILAYLQCLLSDKDKSTIIVKYESIISLSLVVIESMQRSNATQYKAVNTFLLSFDAKYIRQKNLDDLLKMGSDFDHCLSHLSIYFTSCNTSSNLVTAKSNTSSPLDVSNLLLLLIKIVLYTGKTSENVFNNTSLELFMNLLINYLMKDCNIEELLYLQSIRILSSDLCNDIVESRKCFNSETKQQRRNDEVESDVTFRLKLEFDDFSINLRNSLTELVTLKSKNNDIAYNIKAVGTHGLVSKIVKDIICSNANDSDSKSDFSHFTHIKTSLQQLKSAGLGLLSSFGIGDRSNDPHPTACNTIIIFISGGMCYHEIYEVSQSIQSEIERYSNTSGMRGFRIILVTNRIISSDDILHSIYKQNL